MEMHMKLFGGNEPKL